MGFPNRDSVEETNPKPEFAESIPTSDARAARVQEWITSWFDEHDVVLDGLAKTIKKIHWDGQDIRDQSRYVLERKFARLGLGFYADSISQDIAEACKSQKVRLELAAEKKMALRGGQFI